MREFGLRLLQYAVTGGIAAVVDAGGFALLVRPPIPPGFDDFERVSGSIQLGRTMDVDVAVRLRAGARENRERGIGRSPQAVLARIKSRSAGARIGHDPVRRDARIHAHVGGTRGPGGARVHVRIFCLGIDRS